MDAPPLGAEMEIDRLIRGGSPSRRADELIAALADAQHGRVARRQLLALGIGPDAIDHRVAKRRLHVTHPGVYAVGHRVATREARWMSAVLAAGADAVLSHRAAAALWGLRQSDRVEVIVPNDRRPSGFGVHRTALPPDEVTVRSGIPVTTVARTLVDLAAKVPKHQLRKAVDEAERLRLTGPLSLADVISRYPGKRGIRAIRAILAEGGIGLHITRSEFEDRFRGFIEQSGLPRPDPNGFVAAGGRVFECDAVWSEQQLIVELDSRGFHDTRAAFERDRERDRILSAAGWLVVRVTWRQLHLDRSGVQRDLATLLRRRGYRP
jgi:hypothetical protein